MSTFVPGMTVELVSTGQTGKIADHTSLGIESPTPNAVLVVWGNGTLINWQHPDELRDPSEPRQVKRYEVTIEVPTYYTVTVEATDHGHAEDEALAVFDARTWTGEPPAMGDAEVSETEELRG